jgi:hypothetical protein
LKNTQKSLIKENEEEGKFAHSERSKALFNLSLSLSQRSKCFVCCDFFILKLMFSYVKERNEQNKQKHREKTKIIYRELKKKL